MAVIACYAKCTPCSYGEHFDPAAPHPWADDVDRLLAVLSGRPEPAGDCACRCAKTATGAEPATLVTSAEVAAALGLNIRQVRDKARTGELAGIKHPGGHWRFNAALLKDVRR